MAPFSVYVPISGTALEIARIFAAIMVVCVVISLVIPMLMSHLLAWTIRGEFQSVNRQFRQAIDGNGKFKDNIEEFRQRHQHLSYVTKEADFFMRVGNVGEFVCMTLNSITMFYLLIFHSSEVAIPLFILSFALNFSGVFSSTYNSVIVNYEVRSSDIHVSCSVCV